MSDARRPVRRHPDKPTPVKRLTKSTKAIIVAAFTSVAVAAVSGIAIKIYTSVSEKITAPASDLGVAVSVDHRDQNYSVVFEDRYTITQAQVDMASGESAGQGVDELNEQLVRDGGVFPLGMIVTVRIANLLHDPIRIIALRPQDLVRKPPLAGALIYLPPQGGVNTMPMALNLDDRGLPIPRAVDDGGRVREPFFTKREIDLKPGELTTLKLFVATGKYSATFKLTLGYVVGTNDEVKAQNVDYLGRPFRISAYNCDPSSGVPSYQRLYGMTTPSDPRFRLRFIARPRDLTAEAHKFCEFDFAREVYQLYQG